MCTSKFNFLDTKRTSYLKNIYTFVSGKFNDSEIIQVKNEDG